MSKAKRIYVAKEKAGKAFSKAMQKKLYRCDKAFETLPAVKPAPIKWGSKSRRGIEK